MRGLVGPSSPAWRDALQRVRHDVYHLPEYVMLDAALAGGEACAYIYADDHGVLLLPLVIRPIVGRDRMDASSPYGYPAPVATCSEETFWFTAFDGLVEALADYGVISCFIRLHPLLPAVTDAMARFGAVVQHGETISIDLRPPVDQIFRGFRENHRRQIGRARRAGRRVLIDDWSRLPDFVGMYHDTMRRVGATDYYFFDHAYFERLRALPGDSTHLMTVVADDRTLGGGIFFECGGTVQYHLGATLPAALVEQPTKLMFDEAFRWARSRGNSELHLGAGVGGEDNPLLHFKLGFSRRRFAFHTARLVIDTDMYADLAGLPDAANRLDSYFPAYRSPA